MKKDKILFWVPTIIIFLFEGVMSVFFFNSEASKIGIAHLGYPEYFRVYLMAFKILGALALIIPQVPKKVKEWAYAGFTFDFVFAFISHWVVDGFGQAIFPLVFLGILALSYIYYHKLNDVEIP